MSDDGLLLGKYRLLERLGEGGMGTVFRARDEFIDRDVAIKQLRPELAPDGGLTERFRAEAVMLARLSHPCIATLHALDRQDDRFYMVMEYLPGETLEALVARGGPVPWERAVEICRCVLDALEHAHERGIVHRDIKPANIMVTPECGVKVMDFGIARVMGRTRHTRQGHAVGTPAYMAPEQLRGEEVDGRADLYALGAVLYELLAGHVAFDADSDYRLMMMQLHDAPPAPGAAIEGLPREFDRIVARAMAKRPADRYADAAAMRAALQSVRAPREPAAAARWQLADLLVAAPALRGLAPTSLRRVFGADSRAELASWSRDWRGWVTLLCLCLAGVLAFRAFGPGTTRGPGAGGGGGPAAASDSTVVVPGSLGALALAAGNDSVRPARAGSGSGGAAAPANGRAVAPPGGFGQDPVVPPVSGGTVEPEPRRPPSPTPARPAPQEPPRQRDRTPAVVPDPAPEREAPPSDAERRRLARAAAVEFLGRVAAGDGSAGRALSGDGATGDLLTLVREGRLSSSNTRELSLTLNGDQAQAVAQLDLSYRTPFGGKRESTVRLSMQLTSDSGQWRVSAARVVSGSLR